VVSVDLRRRTSGGDWWWLWYEKEICLEEREMAEKREGVTEFSRQKLTPFTLLIKCPRVGFLARVPDEPHLR
jgi:hypothetical protein